MFGWLFGKKKPDEAINEDGIVTPLSEEQLHQLMQGIFSDIAEAGDLNPRYIDWLESEDDCSDLGPYDPLIYVWNEGIKDGGLGYSLSINMPRLSRYIEVYLYPADPYFVDVARMLGTQLSDTSRSTMDATIQKTGAMPSDICAALLTE
jgi:hypothetical protein